MAAISLAAAGATTSFAAAGERDWFFYDATGGGDDTIHGFAFGNDAIYIDDGSEDEVDDVNPASDNIRGSDTLPCRHAA